VAVLAALGSAAPASAQIPDSVLHIPRAGNAATEPRYLDEMRVVVDAQGGDSSNGHKFGLRVWGYVYGHGITTDDSVKVDVRSGSRSVATARCRVETEPDRSDLATIGTFVGGYFNCETEKNIEALGDLSVALVYVDDAHDREVPLRTLAVRAAAAYSWSGDNSHIGVPYTYSADRMGGSALWIRRPPLGDSAIYITFWASPRGSFARPNNDDLQLRCDRDGTRIANVQVPGRMLHQIAGDTASAQPRGGDEDNYGLVFYQLRTNFSYRGAGGVTTSAHELATNPGQYMCALRFRGETVREFRFAVAPNGDIVAHAEQSGPGAVMLTPGMTLIDTRFPNPTLWEHGVSPAAIRAGSFAGRPWRTAASVATMLGALPSANTGDLEAAPPAGRIEGPARGGRAAAPAAATPAAGGRRRGR